MTSGRWVRRRCALAAFLLADAAVAWGFETLASTMRAIEFRRHGGDVGPGGALYLQTDRPLPSVGPDDVLLRVAYAGVCGSDLHILRGTSRYADRVVLGHEMSGTVVALGANCAYGDGRSPRIGTAASVCPQYSCGKCRNCARGRSNFCSDGGGYASTIGYYSDGCFAEYVSVHRSQVYPLPPGLALDRAVFCEPFNCLLNGFKKLGPDLLNDVENARILILGGGIFGLLWSAVLRSRGAKNMIIAEPKAGRLRIAREFLSGTLRCGGTARVVRPNELLADGDRFDIVIECCGEADAVSAGYNMLDVGGTLLVFGGPPKGSNISVDPSDILFKELSIVGSVIGQDTFQTGMDTLVDLEKRGYMDLNALGVEVFELEQYDKARAKLEDGDICKAVFKVER